MGTTRCSISTLDVRAVLRVSACKTLSRSPIEPINQDREENRRRRRDPSDSREHFTISAALYDDGNARAYRKLVIKKKERGRTVRHCVLGRGTWICYISISLCTREALVVEWADSSGSLPLRIPLIKITPDYSYHSTRLLTPSETNFFIWCQHHLQ